MKIKDFKYNYIKDFKNPYLKSGQKIRITFFKDRILSIFNKREIDVVYEKWDYESEEMYNIYLYIIPNCILLLKDIESIEILED